MNVTTVRMKNRADGCLNDDEENARLKKLSIGNYRICGFEEMKTGVILE